MSDMLADVNRLADKGVLTISKAPGDTDNYMISYTIFDSNASYSCPTVVAKDIPEALTDIIKEAEKGSSDWGFDF